MQTGSLVGLICTFCIWRFKRVNDDKFLLHGSQRKSSPLIPLDVPGVPIFGPLLLPPPPPLQVPLVADPFPPVHDDGPPDVIPAAAADAIAAAAAATALPAVNSIDCDEFADTATIDGINCAAADDTTDAVGDVNVGILRLEYDPLAAIDADDDDDDGIIEDDPVADDVGGIFVVR